MARGSMPESSASVFCDQAFFRRRFLICSPKAFCTRCCSCSFCWFIDLISKLHSPVTTLKSTGPDWTQSKMRLKMEIMIHHHATKHKGRHLSSLRLWLVWGRGLKL